MRLRTSFALLLGSAMLLTGCASEEPEPKFAEPSASPSVVKKEETAEEFIRRWAKVEQEMQNTGETEEYRAITKGCESCDSLADRVTKIYQGGGTIEMNGTAVTRVDALDANQHVIWVVNEPTNYRESADAATQQLSGGKRKYVVTLKKSSEGFLMTDLVKQPL